MADYLRRWLACVRLRYANRTYELQNPLDQLFTLPLLLMPQDELRYEAHRTQSACPKHCVGQALRAIQQMRLLRRHILSHYAVDIYYMRDLILTGLVFDVHNMPPCTCLTMTSCGVVVNIKKRLDDSKDIIEFLKTSFDLTFDPARAKPPTAPTASANRRQCLYINW